jgi:hypothetical protein
MSNINVLSRQAWFMHKIHRVTCSFQITREGIKMKRYLVALLAAMTWGTAAQADQILFTASGSANGGQPIAATALFDITGNTLTITLTNIAGPNSGSDDPGSTLTGLFWNFAGAPALSPLTATVAAGSSIVGSCTLSQVLYNCSGLTNVGGEFGYTAGPGPKGANNGISSSGYLASGQPNFNGLNLDDPAAMDGVNFGIISADSGYAPNGGLEAVPVIRDSVVFTLSGAGLTLASLSNVSFQYGTALSEANITGEPPLPPTGNPLPEPGLPALVAIGLLGMAVMRGRRRHS